MNTDSHNIPATERIVRLLLGSLLLVAAFNPAFPPNWFALASTYPILTALIAWDPFYAIFDTIKHKYFDKHSVSSGKTAHA